MRTLRLAFLLAAAAACFAQTTGRITITPNAADSAVGELRFEEKRSSGTNYVALLAPDSVAANKSFVLPSADGKPGNCLKTSGFGHWSFAECAEVLSTNYDWVRVGGTGVYASSGTTLDSSGSNKELTFPSCPSGLAKGVELRIANAGTPETVRIKSSTCFLSGISTGPSDPRGTQPTGVIVFDTLYAHPGLYFISSATRGIAEAVADTSAGFHRNVPTTVRVPAGEHNIWGTVYIPEGGSGAARGIVIKGDGQYTTSIRQNVSQSAFVFDYGEWNQLRSLRVTFAEGVADPGLWAVELRGQTGPRVEDVYIQWAPNGILVTDSTLADNPGTGPVELSASLAVNINNINIRSVLTGGVGIKIDGQFTSEPGRKTFGDDYFISGISMYGVELRETGPKQVPAACIEVKSGGGVNITGRTSLANCDVGLLIDPEDTQDVRWMFLSDLALDNNGIGMYIHAKGGALRSLSAGSNFWVSSNVTGILTEGTGPGSRIDGITIGTGSRIANNEQHGLNHQFGQNLHVHGAHFCGNGWSATVPTYDGIRINPNLSDFSLQDIVSGACDSFIAATQRFGVHIGPGLGTADRYKISGQLHGNFGIPAVPGVSAAVDGALLDGGVGLMKSIDVVKQNGNTITVVGANRVDLGYSQPKTVLVAGPTPIQWLGNYADLVDARNPFGEGHVLHLRFGDDNPGGFLPGGNIISGRMVPRQNSLVTCVMQADKYWFCSGESNQFSSIHINTPAGSAPTNSFHIWDRDVKHVLVMGTRAGDIPDRVQIGFFDTGPTNAAGTVTYDGGGDNRRWKEVYMPGRLRTWEFSAARGDFYPGNTYDGLRVFDSDQISYLTVVPLDANSASIGYWKTASNSFGSMTLQGVVKTANLEILASNTTAEGGNIFLQGAGTNPGWTIDLEGSAMRIFTTSSATNHKVAMFSGAPGSIVELEVWGPISGKNGASITGGDVGITGNLVLTGNLNTTAGATIAGGLTVNGGFACSGVGCPITPGGSVAYTHYMRNSAGTGTCTITFNTYGAMVPGGTCF